MKRSELRQMIKEEIQMLNEELDTASKVLNAINKTKKKPTSLSLEFRAGSKTYNSVEIKEEGSKLVFYLK